MAIGEVIEEGIEDIRVEEVVEVGIIKQGINSREDTIIIKGIQITREDINISLIMEDTNLIREGINLVREDIVIPELLRL